MELRQTLQLKQQLRLTLQLQQAIKLLQLNRLELANLVQEELAENPVLEEMPTVNAEEVPMTNLEIPEPTQQEPKEDDDWKKIIEEVREMGPLPSTGTRRNEDLPPFESTLSKGEDLYDHLNWQLRMSRLSDQDLAIGSEVIGNLGNNGYMPVDAIPAIAQELRCMEDDVDRVRRIVMNFDPVGVAATCIEECLEAQVLVLHPGNALVLEVVRCHLKDLVGRNILTLARRLGVTDEEMEEAREVIVSLDPKPGRNFTGEQTRYVVPDVFVRRMDDDYIVLLNEDGLPKLRISGYYKNLIDRGLRDVDTKEYLKKKVRSAVWFLKSIHQRQSTVRLVAESIVRFQRGFLDNGVGQLKPLVLRDVADDIEMHESTVSRVTSNKYMHTPRGIYAMKFFFNPGIESSSGADLASEAVREKIRTLISQENARTPLSDQQLVALLDQQGLRIARRTVAKYRGQLGILSSSKRVKLGHER